MLDEDTEQVFLVEEPSIGLQTFALTRESLIEEITAHVFMLFDEYARESDENLTAEARQLAARIRSRLTEVTDAQETP